MIDKWEDHRLKGGYDQKVRWQKCECGIVRENHQVTQAGELACPSRPGQRFRVSNERPTLGEKEGTVDNKLDLAISALQLIIRQQRALKGCSSFDEVSFSIAYFVLNHLNELYRPGNPETEKQILDALNLDDPPA